MHHHHTIRSFAIGCCTALILGAQAQPCAILPNAIVGPTLISSPNSETNRTAVAWNPNAQLYYSVDAGNPTFEIDTYDQAFNLLMHGPQGFDYRGAWWNPNTAQLEGNGYASLGIFVQDLQVDTGYPLGTGTVILTGAQPDPQSVGTYDPVADEILYYFNYGIYRYARATNAFVGTTPITGLPPGSINSNSIAYIGCAGHEIGIYDYANLRLLFINKATGAYVGACQLPANAPPTSMFDMSYCNGIFWLYDDTPIPHVWHGYQVVGSTVGLEEVPLPEIALFPDPAADAVNVNVSGAGPARNLRVVDGSGRPVRCAIVPTGANAYQVDVSALGAGTYVLQATTAERSIRRSFVVAR